LQSILRDTVAAARVGWSGSGYCEDDAEKTIQPVAGRHAPRTWSAKRPGEERDTAGVRPVLRFEPARRVGSMISGRIRGVLLGASPPSPAATLSCMTVPLIAYDKPRGLQWISVARSIFIPRCATPLMRARSSIIRCLATSMAHAVTALRGRLAEDLASG